MAALSVENALALILQDVTPLEAERVALWQAHGRTLAQDLITRLTQPPFAASAMDGYAVRLADIATLPATVLIVGESAAGSAYPGTINQGQAVRILTGAPIPDGADCIVIQENTVRSGADLTVREGTPDKAHIRPMGGDFLSGVPILQAGRTLDARALSLAAASGHDELPVRRRPRVAILATGDELVPPGVMPGPDQIVSSNPVGLAALVTACGGQPILLGIAPDNQAAIEACLSAAKNADILLTTGGASVGDHDLIRPALENLGMTLSFWNLAMRPGKPMIFGHLANQRVLGLPGNPVSALITARVFLCPLIAALLGKPTQPESTVAATLTVGLDANGPRQHYMRGVMRTSDTGTVVVAPLLNQDSSLLSLLSAANCLIVRPPFAQPQPIGAVIPVQPLDF
jgi:molybdopterin molybdotransferase